MSTETGLMEWLEPPDHGLGELKAKISRRTVRRKAVTGVGATVVVIASATAVLFDADRSTQPPAVSDSQWQLAVSAQDVKLRIVNGASLELSAPDADTRIYLVSAAPYKPGPGSG